MMDAYVWTVTSIYNTKDIFLSVFESRSLATECVMNRIRDELGLPKEGELRLEDHNWSMFEDQDTIEYYDEDSGYTLIIKRHNVITKL